MTKRAKELARFLKKNPNDSFSRFALALEFLKMNETHKARILFESIRADDPEYVGVYYHLGKLYRDNDAPDEAIEVYEEGIRIAEQLNELHAKSELQTALMNLRMDLL